MSDDARWPLSEEARARIRAARTRGGLCAICGRVLAAGETVWREWIAVGRPYGDRAVSWWAPVGRECASPPFRATTETTEPERCASCGRGVYYRPDHPRHGPALCSRACDRRHRQARAARRGRGE